MLLCGAGGPPWRGSSFQCPAPSTTVMSLYWSPRSSQVTCLRPGSGEKCLVEGKGWCGLPWLLKPFLELVSVLWEEGTVSQETCSWEKSGPACHSHAPCSSASGSRVSVQGGWAAIRAHHRLLHRKRDAFCTSSSSSPGGRGLSPGPSAPSCCCCSSRKRAQLRQEA